jgi:hypothetical protein
LFDISEVKGRYIRDRLDMLIAFEIGVGFAFEIGIGSGNGGNTFESDRLRKSGAQVRVLQAAVATGSQ